MKEKRVGFNVQSESKRGRWGVLFLVPILFLLQFASVSAKENTEELPEALVDALWEYVTDAYEADDVYTVVSEPYLYWYVIEEQTEDKISFYADIICSYKLKADSAYDDWYMKGIFDALGIQSSDVKDLSEEELSQYLLSVGYEEEAEQLASFIVGTVALRQPICEQLSLANTDTGEGAQGVYVEAEYTNGEYVITAVKDSQDMGENKETYPDFEQGIITAEELLAQGREQLDKLFPNIEPAESIVDQDETDSTDQGDSADEQNTPDVLSDPSITDVGEANSGMSIGLYVIVIGVVIVVGVVIGVVAVRRKKQ